MRKIFIALLVGTTILTTAACSNGGSTPAQSSDSSAQSSVSSVASTKTSKADSSTESKTESKEESKTAETSAQESVENSVDTTKIEQYVDVSKLGEKTKNDFVNVIAQDKVNITLSGEMSMGTSSAVKSKLAVAVVKDKDNVSMTISMGEMSYKMIKNEKGSYMVNDSTKTAAFQPASDESTTTSGSDFGTLDPSSILSSTDLTKLEYKGNGNEEYSGTAYDYEEYSIDGQDVKFYFDGNTPVMIVGKDDNGNPSILKIETLSNEVPADSFTVPSDYTITDTTSMLGLGDTGSEVSTDSSTSSTKADA